jgi:hypothetical protein
LITSLKSQIKHWVSSEGIYIAVHKEWKKKHLQH